MWEIFKISVLSKLFVSSHNICGAKEFGYCCWPTKQRGSHPAKSPCWKTPFPPFTYIAAKNKTGIESLIDQLLAHVLQGRHHQGNTIVTNSRHYALLLLSQEAIDQVKQGIAQSRSSDLLAVDIRQALQHFGAITGEISSDELLGNIFSNFPTHRNFALLEIFSH